MQNVKVFIPKNTDYYAFGSDVPYSTENDYYTTIQVEEENIDNEQLIKHLAKSNLQKTIAKMEFFAIERWQYIDINIVDLRIIK